MYDIAKIEKNQKIFLSAEGSDLENLLYDWLEKILLLLLIDKVILSDFNIVVDFDKELKKIPYRRIWSRRVCRLWKT